MAEGVSLEFIASQIERALAHIDAIEGQLAALIGRAERNNETLTALVGEVRDFAQAASRAEGR